MLIVFFHFICEFSLFLVRKTKTGNFFFDVYTIWYNEMHGWSSYMIIITCALNIYIQTRYKYNISSCVVWCVCAIRLFFHNENHHTSNLNGPIRCVCMCAVRTHAFAHRHHSLICWLTQYINAHAQTGSCKYALAPRLVANDNKLCACACVCFHFKIFSFCFIWWLCASW